MVDVESAGEYVLEIQLHAAPTPKNDVLTRSKETSLYTLNAKKTKWESIGAEKKRVVIHLHIAVNHWLNQKKKRE